MKELSPLMKDWQNIILAYAMEKCSQFGSKVFDIFWIYTSQIGSDKLRGSPISSFWSCDSDYVYLQQILQMNGN